MRPRRTSLRSPTTWSCAASINSLDFWEKHNPASHIARRETLEKKKSARSVKEAWPRLWRAYASDESKAPPDIDMTRAEVFPTDRAIAMEIYLKAHHVKYMLN